MRAASSVICLGALLIASACRRDAPNDASVSSGVVVAIESARLDLLRDVATASGAVVPATSGDITIYANEQAEIVELPKKEHDVVAVGDLLVRFEIASLTQEMAALQLEV